MKKVTTYIEAGRSFVICEAEGRAEGDGFWAFEEKYVGKDGRLLKQFNGAQGFHTHELADTIKLVSQRIRIDALCESGFTFGEAMCKVFNLPMEMAAKLGLNC